MDRFPQPPDPPDEGNCRRCKRWVGRDELLIDGCIECDDLLIEDMRHFWQGRPKIENQNVTIYEFPTRGDYKWSFVQTPHKCIGYCCGWI